MNHEDFISYFKRLIHENIMAHAYLIETNNLDSALNAVKEIIKIINCPNEYSESCSSCNLCHLLDVSSLPSYIEILPDGKSIKKDAIESLQTSFANKPCFTENNIYTIVSPEKMNNTSFNKLLKFIEEPEDGTIGFLITENKDYVAKTIVSRCEILKLTFAEKEQDTGEIFFQLALDIINHIENNNSNLIWYLDNNLKLNSYSREDITKVFKFMFKIYFDILHGKNEFNISACKVNEKVILIKKYLEELNYNVNIGLLINSFISEVGDIHETI